MGGRRAATVAAAAVLLAVLAGCGESAPPAAPPEVPSAPPAPGGPTSAPARTGTVVTLGRSQFGEVLFDGNGQAVYMFEPEKATTPACYGECAAAWPPAVTADPPKASGGVRQELLGTTPRTDGTTQLTYAGHPLYYYRGEPPGVVRCHNVDLHGGLWYALTASGEIAPLEPLS